MCAYPVDQLVQLASHHPRSPYNCLKFGPNGSPHPYRPLSLHHPRPRTQLTQVWWLCRHPSPPPVPIFGPAGAQNDIPALQSDIFAAIVEPMTVAPVLAPTVKTSASHPLNLSPIIPSHLISLVSSHLSLSTAPTLFSIPLSSSLDLLLTSRRSCLETLDCYLPAPDLPEYGNGISHVLESLTNGDITPLNDKCTSVKQSDLLGNLFLSSCPGKKVRLDGPVGGRNGVCRDIDIDLKRIKDLGVGCIICCLDDEELSFLGIPWSNYESSAHDIGMDILRLPIPEGLAPSDPASLDEALMIIIKNYTLRGIPVLVHCRGGVGRAGVVACCWLIKLGLCGWIQDQMDLHDPYPTDGFPHIPLVLRYVRRIIGIVRSRRSTKAVETYEQVKFLVEYVEYLKHRFL